jgi:hypothetical protein
VGQAKVEDLQEERVEAMERHVKVLQELSKELEEH